MKIIIHCSDSPFGDAEEIDKWHKERGFRMIGYHYVILNGCAKSSKVYDASIDGKVEIGRPLNDNDILEPSERGAHVKNLNSTSIGVCLVGNSNSFTNKQIIALEEQVLPILKEKFETITIYQHSDFDPKKPFCAGLNQLLIDKWNKIFNL